MLDAESGLMRGFRAAGMERVAWSLRRLHCPVGPDALVLEVGSGGNPYPRANVLIDAYEATRQRHWAPLKADRPTVLGMGESLPFRDRSFDFVIASHVLEHSADPERFLSELQRVARAGYIETPDAFMERVNPYRDHRLEVTCRNDVLVIHKKPAWRTDPELVELYEERAKALVAGGLIPRRPFAFHVRYYWEERIAYEIVNPDQDAGWHAPEDAKAAPHGGGARGGLNALLLDAVRALLSQRRRNRAIDVIALLRCPTCHAIPLARDIAKLTCPACGASYTLSNGVPLLYPAKRSV